MGLSAYFAGPVTDVKASRLRIPPGVGTPLQAAQPLHRCHPQISYLLNPILRMKR